MPPDYTRPFGCEAVHVATWEHRDDPGGAGRCVAVQIPEASEPLIAEALNLARIWRARILAVADTPDQIDAIANRIAVTCAQHRRVPYERAAAGHFGPMV